VDARAIKTIKWLKCLGAFIENAEPYGKKGMLFNKFSFRRSGDV